MYYQVKESNVEIKGLTGLHLKGFELKYTLWIIVFFLLYEFVPNVISVVDPFILSSIVDLSSLISDGTITSELASLIADVSFVYLGYTLLFSGALILGRTMFQLRFLRNRRIQSDSYVFGLKHLLKAMWLWILQNLITSALSIFFIFPGIVASYSLRNSFFILAENPDTSVIDCMKMSREQMMGNKMTAFWLDVSFLLMIVLGYLPAGIIIAYDLVDVSTVYGLIVYTIFRLPYYIIMGELYLCRTVFYELILSHGFMNFEYRGEDVFRTECLAAKAQQMGDMGRNFYDRNANNRRPPTSYQDIFNRDPFSDEDSRSYTPEEYDKKYASQYYDDDEIETSGDIYDVNDTDIDVKINADADSAESDRTAFDKENEK